MYKIPSFFRLKKPERFEYKPRYYNEHKEHIEELEKKYKNLKNCNKTEEKVHFEVNKFRRQMYENWRSRSITAQSAKSNIRLIILLFILLLISYIIFFK